MKEQFVTYDIALKLKKLGFDEPCFGWHFYEEFNPLRIQKCETYLEIESCTKAPLWQQVIDWFEEKYNLHIKFDLIGHSKIMHTFKIYSTGDIFLPRKEENTTSYFGECYESFKEAREQAILKVLELIK